MSPVTHFLISWSFANLGSLSKMEMTAVTVAGVAPDLDAAGIVADLGTRASTHPVNLYGKYHHVLGHNALFCVIVAGVCALLARKKSKVFLLAVLTFHVHLLCDLAGSRGPDGNQWPIAYLFPFTSQLELVWGGQWALNGWPNFAITIAALVLCFWFAWNRGFSPLGIFAKSADERFVETLRRRFPRNA